MENKELEKDSSGVVVDGIEYLFKIGDRFSPPMDEEVVYEIIGYAGYTGMKNLLSYDVKVEFHDDIGYDSMLQITLKTCTKLN